ncbi:MAG: Rieske (2Fe-2S) protein [Rhodothermales bacterium]|nr:Rieske (2Fe-2S) protein [Rhodothermales bacterium]
MMDRRSFVRQVAGVTAGIGCLSMAAGCAGLPYVAAEPVDRGLRVNLLDLAELDYALLDVGAGVAPIFLWRSPDGFTAVSTRCSHRGCTVSPEGEELACPCHGSRFTFDGDVLEGPAPTDLTRFAVVQDADHLIIESAAP